MNPLFSRLAILRRRLRMVATVRGSCWTLAVLIGSLTVACLFDVLVYRGLGLELPGLIRGLFLAGILVGASSIGYLWLLQPLLKKLNDLSLALRVEAEYPILNDALASTVEFLQASGTPDRTVSPTLKREAVQRAMRLMQGCDFNKAIDARGLRWSLGTVAVAALVALPLLLLFPAQAGTALVRVIDPFGDNPWQAADPQTFLDIQYPKKVAAEQQFTITGAVRGKIPSNKKVVLEFNHYLENKQEVLLEPGEDDKSARLKVDLSMAKQTRDFSFRVQIGHTTFPKQGGWYHVTLRQPPQLADLDGKLSPQIELAFPKYTDLPSPVKLPAGQSDIEGVEGTKVTLRGATDRPVAKVYVHYPPKVAGAEVPPPVEAQMAANGREFTVQFTPPVEDSYQLTLEDGEGLSKTYKFKLGIFADPVPVVKLLQPASNRNVLPDAVVELQVSAQDERFALSKVYVDVLLKNSNPKAQKLLVRLPLYDHQPLETILPQTMSALAAKPVPMPLHPLHLRPKVLELSRLLSIKGLGKEGDVLLVQAFAEDFKNRTPGKSDDPPIELRIVGRQALAAVLDEAQGKIQEKLAQIRDQQNKAIQKVEAAEKELRATGKLSVQGRDDLAAAERLQKDIKDKVGADETQGLRGEVDRLQKTLKENNLPRSEVAQRLKTIKSELDRLAEGPIKTVEDPIYKTRVNPQKKNDLKAAQGNQQEIKRTVEELLGTLENWAGLNEFKAQVRAILKEQEEIKKECERIHREQPDANNLSPEAKDDVRKLGGLQGLLADRTQKLIEKMERVSVELATKDINTAKSLEKAVQIAQESLLPGLMVDTAKEQLLNKKGGPRLFRAIENQAEACKILESMIEALEEQRDALIDALIKNQKQEQQNLDKLAERLEKLQKRIQQANQLADPKERQAQLDKLAAEQRKLQQDLKNKARELARLQAPQAAKKLDQAAKDLGKAADQLEKGQNPEELQKDAQKKIEQAKNKLKDAQRKAEDELAREIQSKLADRIRALKDRQDAAVVEATRLHKVVLQNNSWPRALLGTQGDLRRDQEALSKDVVSLKEKVKGAVVFAQVLDNTTRSMNNAAKVMEERETKAARRQKPDVAATPLTKEELAEEIRLDQLTQKHQRDASKRLERLLEAMKESLEMAKNEGKGGDGGDGGEGGGAGGGKSRPVDGIPPTAQLKVLREEQQDLARRTLEFSDRHPDPSKLTPAQRQELLEIHNDQETLGNLFLGMLKTLKNEGANP